MKDRKTKKYAKTGIITLDAEAIGGNQEVIDREVSASNLLKDTVKTLYELEEKETPMKLVVREGDDVTGRCPVCDKLAMVKDEVFYCEGCGQKIKGTNRRSVFKVSISAGMLRVENRNSGEYELYRIHTDKDISDAFDAVRRIMMADWADRQMIWEGGSENGKADI